MEEKRPYKRGQRPRKSRKERTPEEIEVDLQKRKQRVYSERQKERFAQDPEALAQRKAYEREYAKKRAEEIKQDPEKLAIKRQRKRQESRARRKKNAAKVDYAYRRRRMIRLHPEWTARDLRAWRIVDNRKQEAKRYTEADHYCKQCGGRIDDKKWNRKNHFEKPKFCTRACVQAWNRESGHMKKMSALGLKAQDDIEAKTGTRPGTDKRRYHAKSLNRARRQGKPWGQTGPKKSEDF